MRYQVSEGKELSEIGEIICELCLAPDTSGAGIGCDNMTVLIVGITHGRTKEEWYEWIKDRVKNEYGYSTPSTLPQLYAQSRLLAFRARREAQEARERMHAATQAKETSNNFNSEDFLRRHGFTITTIGGISNQPVETTLVSDGGTTMFGSYDPDDDDDLEAPDDSSFFARSLGLGRPESPAAKNLRERLTEFELSEDDEVDGDGDANMVDVEQKVSSLSLFLSISFL